MAPNEPRKVSGRVAVIMRTKNRPLLLRRALESVVSQTCQDWVLSIVNDGGEPDAVEELVDQTASSHRHKIVVTHHSRSMGMEAASNAGIRAVDSDFLVIHDDDDAWQSSFLDRTLSVLESPTCPATVKGVVANAEVVIEKVENDAVVEIRRFPWFRNEIPITLWHVCGGNLFPPIAFLYRRSAYESIGPYEETLPVLGDWDFNLRFIRNFDVVRLSENLTYYHLRKQSTDEAYLGTLLHQKELHELHRDLIENRFLREDLDAGKVGLGFVMSMSRDARDAIEGTGRNAESIKEQAEKILESVEYLPEIAHQVARNHHAIENANLFEMAARIQLDTDILVAFCEQNLVGKIDESREILIGLNEAKAKAARIAKKLPFAKRMARKARESNE